FAWSSMRALARRVSGGTGANAGERRRSAATRRKQIMKPTIIVNILLEGNNWVRVLMGEASIHLPRRGKKWVASFTGLAGQQWKSTGTADYAIALARAREFEAAARVQRMNLARAVKRTPGNRQSTAH